MLTQKIHPLWEINPWLFVAVDADENPILTATTKEEAQRKAELKTGKRPWYVTEGWFVRRPILDEKNLITPSIVLFGEKKWQDAKLFVVEKWELPSQSDEKISLWGIYLNWLLEHPYLMLCKPSECVTINTDVDLKWEPRAWAPVMTELESYLPKIQDLCKRNVFDASLPNAKLFNKEVRKGFQGILAFTKKGFPAPEKK